MPSNSQHLSGVFRPSVWCEEPSPTAGRELEVALHWGRLGENPGSLWVIRTILRSDAALPDITPSLGSYSFSFCFITSLPVSFGGSILHFFFFFLSGESKPGKLTSGQLKEGDLKLHEFARGSSASEDRWEQPEMRGVLWKLDAEGKERWRRNKAECYRNNSGMTHRPTNVSPSPGNTINLTKLPLTLPILWTDSSVSLFRMTQVAENYPIKGKVPSQGGSHPRLFGARLCRPGHLP